MNRRLWPLCVLTFIAGAGIIALAVVLWWFQFSDYSYGRQQIRILDAPDVINSANIEALMAERTPRSRGDWWSHFYGHQVIIWRLARIGLGFAAIATIAFGVAIASLNSSLRAVSGLEWKKP